MVTEGEESTLGSSQHNPRSLLSGACERRHRPIFAFRAHARQYQLPAPTLATHSGVLPARSRRVTCGS